jgi:NADPH-dependent 2,4-dienoyl-CoA reductase/sulfur reductase-like enzyme
MQGHNRRRTESADLSDHLLSRHGGTHFVSERFDILVVGAGPAGIAAAISASASGKRVGLVDDNPKPGGQIWRSGIPQEAQGQKWLAKLDDAPVVKFQGWRVFDHPEPGTLRAERNQECRDLRYEKLILATGARELFLPFPGWTLPNVMGAGALDAMVRGGLPIAEKRVVVAGTGPLLLAVAAHLSQSGAKVVALCEQAPLRRFIPFAANLLREPSKLAQGRSYLTTTRGTHFYSRCWPIAATGKEKLESVTLQRAGKNWDVRCDYLACGFHLVPNLELAALLGCRIEDGFVVTDDLLRTSAVDVFCAGEPTGIGGVDLALLEGQIAGVAAAGRKAEAERLARHRGRRLRFVKALRDVSALDPKLRKLAAETTLVCRCEDVSYGALREHTCWRDAKLQTRCGMGPCQGRVCGAATEFLFSWGSAAVESTMRPPIFPVMVSSLRIPHSQTHPGDELTPAVTSTSTLKETL